MRKITFIISLIALAFFSCSKTDTRVNQSVVDEEKILDYIEGDTIDWTRHYSGVYYTITNIGIGGRPTSNSEVKVDYTGYFLTDTAFTEGVTDYYPLLSTLIQGWQYCIPMIGYSGEMEMIIPSALAYGASGTPVIDGKQVVPPNTVLIYEVKLLDFR